MNKWSSIFVMAVKENNNCASNLLTLLDKNLSRYVLSLYSSAEDKYSKCSPIQIIIRTIVSLYYMFIVKDDKTKFISNPFL